MSAATASSRPGLRPPTRPSWKGPPDALRVVWTQPRGTVRWILDHGDPRLALLIVIGVALTVVAADGPTGDTQPALGTLAWWIEIPSATLLAVTLWVLSGLVLTALGRLLGGAGSVREVLTAVAWGQVPAAAGLPIALLYWWSTAVDSPTSQLLCAILLFLLALWSIATTTLAVAEAHRFSAGRSVLCVAATGILYGAAAAALTSWLGFDAGL
jgi:hypothetical protein